MTTAAHQAEARFFHVALGPPDAASHRLLRRAGLRDVLAQLAADGAVVPPRLRVPRTLSGFETEYLAAFDVGVPHPPVPLLECHWERRRAANQIVAENNRFYGAFGMRPRAGHESPDHLVCQLAFVEYLLWAIGEREGRGAPAGELRWALGDFLALHLQSWVPAAAAAAGERRLRPVFGALLGALAGWLRRLAVEYPAGCGASAPGSASAS